MFQVKTEERPVELPEKVVRIIESWRRDAIWIDPCHLVMELLHTEGRGVYLAACDLILKVFRERLGVHRGVFFHVHIFPGFVVSVAAAKRPGEDTLSSSDAPALIHPLPEEKESAR